MTDSLIVFRLDIFGPSSCVWVVLLVSLQIFFEDVVVSLAVADNGTLQFIVMYFSWFFDVCFELFPFYAFSLDDFFDTSFSFCLVFCETFAVILTQLFLYGLLLTIISICLCRDGFILINLDRQLREQLLVDLLQVFDIHLSIFPKLRLLFLDLFDLLFERLDVQLHLVFYLSIIQVTPILLRSSVSSLCSSFSNLEYYSSILWNLTSSNLMDSKALKQAYRFSELSRVETLSGMASKLHSLQSDLIFQKMLGIVRWVIELALQQLTLLPRRNDRKDRIVNFTDVGITKILMIKGDLCLKS